MGDMSKSSPKKTSRILAALDHSMLASSSSSHTTIQTSQILGKRKSDTFPVSPARRVHTLPDIGSTIHGPHSPFNRPVHASKSSADIRYYHLMSRLQLPQLVLRHKALHLELADLN
jgi:hypothetical protein